MHGAENMTKYKIILVGMIIVLTLLSGCIETIIDGKHSGQITAIEKSGLIWKTYTVYVKTDISSSQEDVYCVEDLSLIPELEKLSGDRQKVTIIYRDEFFKAPWRCNQYEPIITGVEE